MAWIESHQSLGGHLKLRRLARSLGIHRAQAVGHLHYLWWWALDCAPTGDLSALSAVEVAEVAEWPGEPEPFVAALRECGWLDPDGRIHDWQDYAGRLVEERRKDRERKRRVRRTSGGHPAGKQRPQTGRRTDGGSTQPYPTLPNPTVPNPTPPDPTGVCAHTPPARGGTATVPEEPPPPGGAHPPERTHTPEERELPSRVIPSLEVVLHRAQQIGLADWKARDWFDEMEGCGWKDYAGRDIRRWEAVLQRIAVKWRADGSPTSPPAAFPPGPGPRGRAVTPIDHSKGF